MRRSAMVMATAALLFGAVEPAFASDELPDSGSSLVQVFVDTEADIEALVRALRPRGVQAGRGRRNDPARIDATPAERAELRATGFRIGATIETPEARRGRRRARRAARDRQLARSTTPRTACRRAGPPSPRPARPSSSARTSSRTTPARSSTSRRTTRRPASGHHHRVPARRWRCRSRAPTASTARRPNMPRFIDTDPTPDEYMYNRQLIRLTRRRRADPGRPDDGARRRQHGRGGHFKVTSGSASTLPPHVAGYQQGFFNRYQDPTENRAQLDKLAAEFPNLVTAVNLPNLTNGYQRKSQAILGALAGDRARRSSRSPTRRRSLAAAEAPGRSSSPPRTGATRAATRSPPSSSPARRERAAAVAVDRQGDQVTSPPTPPAPSPARPPRSSPRSTPSPAAARARDGHHLPRQRGRRHRAAAREGQPDGLPQRSRDVRAARSSSACTASARIRDGTKVGVFLFCQQHAREWTTGLTCLETAERLVENYATDPETKKLLDNVEVFISPNVNPDGGALLDVRLRRRSASNMTNHCAGHGQLRPGRPQHLGRRPEPQQRRVLAASTATSARRRAAPATPTPARRSTPSRRRATRSGSRTRSRTSSSRTTSTPSAATSCGRRAPT